MPAIARYAVGAVKAMVARKRSIASSSAAGVPCSSSTADAPTRIGKSTSPPRPKVKASGGVPQKTSSARGRSTWGGKQSHTASTSRWKCIVPLPCPVVPDVNAISATSSAAVSQAVNVSGLPSISASSEPAPPSPPNGTVRPP
jgi:hypothetical protein